MTNDKCCTGRCNQGRDCPIRQRVTNLTRAIVGYGVFLLCLMSAASAIAVWLAKWGTA